MSIAALDRMGHGFAVLREALDGDDLGAIEAVLDGLRVAVAEVRASGAWRDIHDVTGRIREMQPLIEAVRVRVNVLADMNSQRLELIGARTGKPMQKLVYGR